MRKTGGQFLHTIQVTKRVNRKVWKNYSEIKWRQVGVGKTSKYKGYAPERSINNQAIEDQLYELRSGKAGEWTVPSDILEWCPEYGEHINTHIKVNVSKDEAHEDYRWTLNGNQEQHPDHLYVFEQYLVGQAIEAELVTDISATHEAPQSD